MIVVTAISRWIGAIAILDNAPELGRWHLTGRDAQDWLECKPLDPSGIDLARLGSGGKLWFRQQDLTRLPPQTEELF